MKENYEERIDRALHVLGQAEPAPGMEARIHARLAQAGAHADQRRRGFFRIPQLAFGLAAATLAFALIVVGSVSHSRHMLPQAPGLQVPGLTQPGVGAASGARVAPQPVTALPQDRPRSIRKRSHGRSAISARIRKRAGIAVPKTLPSGQQAH